MVDQRAHGLANQASSSRDALRENQDKMLEAVNSNDKLTKESLAESNKTLDCIGKLQGSDQKILKMQCLVKEKLSREKRERLMAEKECLDELNKFTKEITELHAAQQDNQRALEAITKKLQI